MSSLFNLRLNRHFNATTTANVVFAASVIMIAFILMEGWLW